MTSARLYTEAELRASLSRLGEHEALATSILTDIEANREPAPERPAVPGVTRWRRRGGGFAEAVQVTLDNIVTVADWISDSGAHCDQYERHLRITEAAYGALLGDWVIRYDVPESCFAVLSADLFSAAYEPAPEPLVMPQDEFAAVKKLAEIVKHAGKWAALAPADDWGATPVDTVVSDCGRAILAIISSEEKETQ